MNLYEKKPTTIEQMVSLAQELCDLQEGMAVATRSLCYMMAHELNKEPKNNYSLKTGFSKNKDESAAEPK